jgi:hypothetical protein
MRLLGMAAKLGLPSLAYHGAGAILAVDIIPVELILRLLSRSGV